jgi:hypothetical protein
MARIYKRTDRIPVKIDDVVITLAPLSLSEKTDIQQAMLAGRANGNLKEATRGIQLALKYGIKGISGVEDSDGPYVLQFEGEHLTDACVDDLLNMEITNKLALVCMSLAVGVPTEFTDENKQPLAGVEIVKVDKEASEKK